MYAFIFHAKTKYVTENGRIVPQEDPDHSGNYIHLAQAWIPHYRVIATFEFSASHANNPEWTTATAASSPHTATHAYANAQMQSDDNCYFVLVEHVPHLTALIQHILIEHGIEGTWATEHDSEQYHDQSIRQQWANATPSTLQ